MSGQAKCSGCGAPIRWGKTSAGKAVPLEQEPTSEGSAVGFRFTGVGDAVTFAKALDGCGPVFESHFARCPKSAAFRRK